MSPPAAKSGARRAFLKTIGLASLTPAVSRASEPPPPAPRPTGDARAREAFEVRVNAAATELTRPAPLLTTNGDEDAYASRLGSYSKCLPHDRRGEVDSEAYESLLAALSTGDSALFERIPLGLGRKLVNPQSGLTFELEGGDPQSFAMRPPPAFSSAEIAGEMTELYWMALLRDIPFSEYRDNGLAAMAAADLSRQPDFRGPKQDGRVTPATLFRDPAPGCETGPYISQFLWMAAPFGAETIDRRMRTTAPGSDYLTSPAEWLANQNGATAFAASRYDSTRRFIRNGRDLGEWVHIDVLYQAFLTALLSLTAIGAARDRGNPYLRSRTQVGFGTFGDPHIAALVASIARPALNAVWAQKWYVHRRLRPEEFGGRVHFRRSGEAIYPLHPAALNTAALDEIASRHGSYLLPQAYPEGSPAHPSYGSGHAVVAGACATVLKAFFDESFVLPNPVEVSSDGTTLTPYRGAPLTVGGELSKLAANIAHGRNIAGVHWRSDATESMLLGEEVALRCLRQQSECVHEEFGGFSLTRFDGTTITV